MIYSISVTYYSAGRMAPAYLSPSSIKPNPEKSTGILSLQRRLEGWKLEEWVKR
jgi:hypothetical protein